MWSYSQLLPELDKISGGFLKTFQKDVKDAFEYLEHFEKDYESQRNQRKEKAPNDKVRKATLQSIVEDDGAPEVSSSNSNSMDSNGEQTRSKKRSKNEAEDILSPEVDKRLKRSASVKAQTFISKQVNVNLSAKLRREKSTEPEKEADKPAPAARARRRRDDKENAEPNVPAALPVIQIKEEKLSLVPEPMETDAALPVKLEPGPDERAMPPPALPPAKSRKALTKNKSEESTDEESGSKRSTRSRKHTAEGTPTPQVSEARSTRASARAAPPPEAPPAARPKRTRGRKKASVSEPASAEVEAAGGAPAARGSGAGAASPAEKPRPKRTRRGKPTAQEPPKPAEPLVPKEEPVSASASPILQKDVKPKKKADLASNTTRDSTGSAGVGVLPKDLKTHESSDGVLPKDSDTRDSTGSAGVKGGAGVLPKDMDTTRVIARESSGAVGVDGVLPKNLDTTRVIARESSGSAGVAGGLPRELDATRVISRELDQTKVLSKEMDQTFVLPNGLYSREREDSNKLNNVNESAPSQPAAIMDGTVIIEKARASLTEDSLLTEDDSDEFHTPPARAPTAPQPSSAVKEKVQQFEELASRVTRTKTRARARLEGAEEGGEPPAAPALPADTLHKMNSLIFNGKHQQPQISSSACKPRAPAPAVSKPAASASKLSALGRQRDAAEEDARRKKEALLDAKKEQQRRKREEKMAAAAAARSQAERERRAQLELQARERMEKQAHADLGKMERMREHERKKLEMARKAAETEERRRAEEAARALRLAEEQRRALQHRRKQIEEQEAMKKEAVKMAKDIEKRQKEYKQRMKSRLEDKVSTPLKTPLKAPLGHVSPVYMADGFQFLCSDSDDERPPRPVPDWSTTKRRSAQLGLQSEVSEALVSRLFSVRVHSPDLADIFPSIERARLKRTSSAVWRTPPALATLPE